MGRSKKRAMIAKSLTSSQKSQYPQKTLSTQSPRELPDTFSALTSPNSPADATLSSDELVTPISCVKRKSAYVRLYQQNRGRLTPTKEDILVPRRLSKIRSFESYPQNADHPDVSDNSTNPSSDSDSDSASSSESKCDFVFDYVFFSANASFDSSSSSSSESYSESSSDSDSNADIDSSSDSATATSADTPSTPWGSSKGRPVTFSYATSTRQSQSWRRKLFSQAFDVFLNEWVQPEKLGSVDLAISLIHQKHPDPRVDQLLNSIKSKINISCPEKIQKLSFLFDEQGELCFLNSKKQAAQFFGVTRYVIKEARLHAMIYGPGSRALVISGRTRRKIQQTVLDELSVWVESSADVRSSSCRSVKDSKTVELKPVLYLLSTKNALWKRYKTAYPNGVKKSFFLEHIDSQKYQRLSLLGGLCSVCDGSGYTVYRVLKREIGNNIFRLSIAEQKIKEKILNEWIRHARCELVPVSSQIHVNCATHCEQYALGECPSLHESECILCSSVFELIDEFSAKILALHLPKNHPLSTEHDQLSEMAKDFMGHRFRTNRTNR